MVETTKWTPSNTGELPEWYFNVGDAEGRLRKAVRDTDELKKALARSTENITNDLTNHENQINTNQTNIQNLENTRLTADNIIAGTDITLTKSGNNITITNTSSTNYATLASDLTNEKDARTQNDNTLQANLDTKLDEQDIYGIGDIIVTPNNTDHTVTISSTLTTEINDLETKHDTELTALKADIKANNILAANITGDNYITITNTTDNGNPKITIGTTLTDKQAALEAEQTVQAGEITALQTMDTTLQGQIDVWNSTLTSTTNTLETTLKTYSDAGDTSTLASAKTYSDTNLTTAKTYADTGDTNTLTAAKTYSDTNLTTAKTYADTGDTNTLTAAKTYSDTNLTTAKTYTDTAETNLTNLINTESNTRETADNNLNTKITQNETDITNLYNIKLGTDNLIQGDQILLETPQEYGQRTEIPQTYNQFIEQLANALKETYENIATWNSDYDEYSDTIYLTLADTYINIYINTQYQTSQSRGLIPYQYFYYRKYINDDHDQAITYMENQSVYEEILNKQAILDAEGDGIVISVDPKIQEQINTNAESIIQLGLTISTTIQSYIDDIYQAIANLSGATSNKNNIVTLRRKPIITLQNILDLCGISKTDKIYNNTWDENMTYVYNASNNSGDIVPNISTTTNAKYTNIRTGLNAGILMQNLTTKGTPGTINLYAGDTTNPLELHLSIQGYRYYSSSTYNYTRMLIGLYTATKQQLDTVYGNNTILYSTTTGSTTNYTSGVLAIDETEGDNTEIIMSTDIPRTMQTQYYIDYLNGTTTYTKQDAYTLIPITSKDNLYNLVVYTQAY